MAPRGRTTNDTAPRLRVDMKSYARFLSTVASPGHGLGPTDGGHATGSHGGDGHFPKPPGNGSGGGGGGGHFPKPGGGGHGHGGQPGGGGHFTSLESTAFALDDHASEAVNATYLVPIEIASIYEHHGQPVNLPERMAWCTPDMFDSLVRLDAALHAEGGRLVLSDLFRTYDMQLQAHLDWKTGKKSAYSPPPGESMHEAGRAFDLDLKQIGVGLAELWKIAASCGLTPIIATPNPSADEAWHFDCRGSHDRVYKYYAAAANPVLKPYTAMSISAVLAIGGRVDRMAHGLDAAAVQCALIRLGFDPGPIDGFIGPATRTALAQAGVVSTNAASMREELEFWLRTTFPREYEFGAGPAPFDHVAPDHLIS